MQLTVTVKGEKEESEEIAESRIPGMIDIAIETNEKSALSLFTES